MILTDEQSKRIQILRGLAIIAVVFIHNTPEGILQFLVRPFLNFGVGLFLFLSGFLSNRNFYNPKKRIMKVGIPYIIWTLIYVCLNNIGTLSVIPSSYVKSLLFADSAAMMYYIFVYCQFTLLIPLIDKLANSKFKYLGFIISPVEIILMRTIPLVMGYQINGYLQKIISISCLGWFVYFYLGYLIGKQKLKIKYNTTMLFGLLSLSIILQMLEGYWYWSLGYTNCGTQLKISSILSGVLFMLIAYGFINTPKSLTSNFLCVLGNYSFGIYFSHIAIMFVLSHLPYYKECVVYPLNGIVAILVSLVMCCIGKKIFKKYSWIIAL